MDWLVRCSSVIRSVRSEMQITHDIKFPVEICGAAEKSKKIISDHVDIVQNSARLQSITFSEKVPKGAMQVVFGKLTLALKVSEAVDLNKEKQRLSEEIKKIDNEIKFFSSKLENKDFVKKAPTEVVNDQQAKKNQALVTRKKLTDALNRIKLVK